MDRRAVWDLPSTPYGRVWVPSARKAVQVCARFVQRRRIWLQGCRTSTTVDFSRREYSSTVSIYLPRMMRAASDSRCGHIMPRDWRAVMEVRVRSV